MRAKNCFFVILSCFAIWPSNFVGYAPLRLEGWGDDKLKALESFADQFAGMWDWIATTPDRNLTPGARKLKRVLASLVERVA